MKLELEQIIPTNFEVNVTAHLADYEYLYVVTGYGLSDGKRVVAYNYKAQNSLALTDFEKDYLQKKVFVCAFEYMRQKQIFDIEYKWLPVLFKPIMFWCLTGKRYLT